MKYLQHQHYQTLEVDYRFKPVIRIYRFAQIDSKTYRTGC